MNQDDFKRLLSDVSEIKRAVVGDTKWGEKGLIKRVELLEGWKSSINLKVAYTSGLVVGLVEAAKYGIELFTNHKP